MYKRMADAGFLAKEPGMGAADIAKTYERCHESKGSAASERTVVVVGPAVLFLIRVVPCRDLASGLPAEVDKI